MTHTAQTYDRATLEREAHAAAELFRIKFGAPMLKVVPPPPELLRDIEVRMLGHRSPGWYTTAGIFSALRGRTPTHGEAVKAGQMLGAMGWERKKHGPTTLWAVDKSLAARAD